MSTSKQPRGSERPSARGTEGTSGTQRTEGTKDAERRTEGVSDRQAWGALWAIVIGFFMILVDTTIVSTAMPAIMQSLDADINSVVWVTSAYLLAYAVPLLITGRLGDRFGPRNLYLLGLSVFTLASLWCGFASSIEILIAARILQGLGAAIMTPQTMAVITRLFPPDRRGPAMGVWGAVAGVASLVGPIAGGLLVDSLGWEWIFFVNIPVGIFAFVRAWQKVPALPRHAHRIDVVGVLLSALGMFGIIFGIQEGHGHAWGPIWGPVTVVEIIVAGVVLMVGFVVWQRFTPSQPLIPLGLFSDRNFSLGNAAISMVGLMITSFTLPFMIYLQLVRGLSPTQAALMLAPMAVVSGGLAPFVGKRLTASNAPWVAVFGTALNSLGLVGYFLLLHPETQIGLILIPSFMMGVGSACMWAPISVTATRDLDPARAGAGAGVYNTTRQVGAVFGSALIAMLMENRLAQQLPGMGSASPVGEMAGGAQLPEALREGFSTAMGQAILLPAAAGLAAALLALCFKRRRPAETGDEDDAVAPAGARGSAGSGSGVAGTA